MCSLVVPHEAILIALILAVGGLAGLINYYRNVNTNLAVSRSKYHYALSGIGAAILVPLFLNMLSSNLIKHQEGFESINYFVFAGFCFIAGYFSDRFIDSIGDKILKELQQTKEKVDSTSDKLEKTSQDVKDNAEKVEALIENESESDADADLDLDNDQLQLQTKLVDDDFQDKMRNIVKSFTGSYKFRSINGLSKEFKYPHLVVEAILEALENHGAVKKFSRNDGTIIWTLTKVGQLLANRYNDQA